MNSTASPSPLEQQLRDMNEALLVSSVRQHELTEQARQAEASLRESESLLRQIADSMPQIVWTARPDGYVDYYNERWYEYTGFPRDEFGQASWERILHPEDVQRCVATYFDCIRDEKPYQIEYRFKDRRRRGYRWFIGRALPLRDEAGAIVRWFGTCTDIDDQKRAEEALRASECRFREMINALPAAIYTTDAQGRLTHFNPACIELSGRTPELGTDHWCVTWKLYHPDGTPLPHEECPMALALKEGRSVRGAEAIAERPDGTRVWFMPYPTPLRDAEGQIVGGINMLVDITERSRLERQTKEQAQELADLHRRKDEFLAMLSHELRNPLAPISNAVQLLRLQQRSEDPIQREARTIIERQVGVLRHLVDDLLEVSRITTGRIQLRQERVAVSGIVAGAVETVRPLLDQRGQELTLALPPEPVWLNADAARLEQVVVNLLTNAAKYTEEGGHVWLTVELEEDKVTEDDKVTRWQGDKVTEDTRSSLSPHLVTLPPCHLVTVRVRDTGVGIAPELLPRIFDLFTQAERSLDRSQGGLGIGLALVQRLTELHGGTVEAYSVLGQGSEFVVRLPVAPTPQARPPAYGAETAEPTTQPLRVLVVDDNVDAAESLAMLLHMAGHEVHTAHDGPAVLQTALEYRPNVVLLDIGLPKLNGYEVAKRLRQQAVLQGVILVAVTGYGQEADRQRSREAGFDYHLVKPVDHAALMHLLAEVSPARV